MFQTEIFREHNAYWIRLLLYSSVPLGLLMVFGLITGDVLGIYAGVGLIPVACGAIFYRFKARAALLSGDAELMALREYKFSGAYFAALAKEAKTKEDFPDWFHAALEDIEKSEDPHGLLLAAAWDLAELADAKYGEGSEDE